MHGTFDFRVVRIDTGIFYVLNAFDRGIHKNHHIEPGYPFGVFDIQLVNEILYRKTVGTWPESFI